jgi:hypothetical protein
MSPEFDDDSCADWIVGGRRLCDPRRMPSYSDAVVANVTFLGDRARELAEQEVDRARTLDTKAAGMVAASIALIAAGAGFASRLQDLHGGEGAKTLWAVELCASLVFLVIAGGLAVWAITPKAFRLSIKFTELTKWVTPRILEQPPTFVCGTVLHADIKSIGMARDTNRKKARRLAWGFAAFAAALGCIVALGISVAIRSAAADNHGRPKTATARPTSRLPAAFPRA